MQLNIDKIAKIDYTHDPKKLDPRDPLENRIFRIITASNFRIGKLSDNIDSMLRAKIEKSIKKDEPITFIVGMGWGKNWHSQSSPHINWAEYFHLHFIYKYLGSICDIYKPGVKIEFTSDDLAVRIINNYEKSWLDTYEEEFYSLLKYFNSNTANNFNYTCKLSSEWYNYEDLLEEVNREVDVIKEDSATSNKLIEDRMNNALNNVVISDSISQEKKIIVLKDSILKHKAWLNVDYRHRAEYLEGGIHIPVAHRKGIVGTYNLRNIESSLVQFWKGEGVLKKNKPTILSPKQLSNSDFEIQVIENDTKIDALNTIPVISTPSS